MLIKTTLIAATAAIGLTGAAMADGAKVPTLLDDQALDNITAGTQIIRNQSQRFTQDYIGNDYLKLKAALSEANDESFVVTVGENEIYISQANDSRAVTFKR